MSERMKNNESLFQYLGARPDKAKRFGISMSAFSTGQGYAVEHLVNGYAWDAVQFRGLLGADESDSIGVFHDVLI